MMVRFIGLFIFSLSLPSWIYAQERCGTVQYEKMLLQRNPKRETIGQFENWIKGKANQLKQSQQLRNQKSQRTQATYTIPVVVHVIHNGEPIGTGVNISDAQILSQITVLNNDFNRLNADKVNTPALFTPVAGSFNVEFVMAKQDPNGLATTGIKRVQGSQSSWTLNDNFLLKAQSYWPAEDYLNIWVTNLTDLLGYAQFPVSSLVLGLDNSSNERLTDGVMITYRAFGTIDAGNFDLKPKYNKGRTLTHEMGHIFGLRHIWGDINDCTTTTDYVADTPAQSSSTLTCPSHPQQDCSTPKMFQNFLDYTDDACMNIFTAGQASRMDIVLNGNTPRRTSLLVSHGSYPPGTAPNDLGIKTILSPMATMCSGSMTPSIVVRNYGINTITSARIQLKQNSITETKDISITLGIGQETTVYFSPLSLLDGTTQNFDFQIVLTNGIVDGNPTNDLKSITTTTPIVASLPLIETFDTLPTNWLISNPDGLKTWQTTTAQDGRKAISVNFYDYKEIGAIDLLASPLITLTSATSAALVFDRAYSNYPGATGDRLRILVTSTCNFNSPTVIFSKSGEALSTSPTTYNSFSPVTPSQWNTEVISLNQFIGQSIQIAFEATNANGNNLFLDNVTIFTGNRLDISFNGLDSPSPVSCVTNPSPVIRVKNIGTIPVSDFRAEVSINGGATQSQTISIPVNSNEEKTITLNTINLSEGNNIISIALTQPNTSSDQFPQNNSGTFNRTISNSRDIIPLRQPFDTNSKTAWSIVSQDQQAVWTSASTNYSNSLTYASFSNINNGDESWLVSPILDLSKLSEAGLFFNTSYAKSIKGYESLRVLASKDCGVTFTDIIYDQSGSSLSNTNSDVSWIPTTVDDWKKRYINLDKWIGYPTVRFAFVATNGNGNNLYLDNIEFFIDDNPNPVSVESSSPYIIYGGLTSDVKITFNLAERQDVRLQIFNTIGQVVTDNFYYDALNQTYTIDMTDKTTGIYIFRAQIGNQFSSTKVYFGN